VREAIAGRPSGMNCAYWLRSSECPCGEACARPRTAWRRRRSPGWRPFCAGRESARRSAARPAGVAVSSPARRVLVAGVPTRLGKTRPCSFHFGPGAALEQQHVVLAHDGHDVGIQRQIASTARQGLRQVPTVAENGPEIGSDIDSDIFGGRASFDAFCIGTSAATQRTAQRCPNQERLHVIAALHAR
jgi:hypothetical protein